MKFHTQFIKCKQSIFIEGLNDGLTHPTGPYLDVVFVVVGSVCPGSRLGPPFSAIFYEKIGEVTLNLI
jgi:hypothetical protein